MFLCPAFVIAACGTGLFGFTLAISAMALFHFTNALFFQYNILFIQPTAILLNVWFPVFAFLGAALGGLFGSYVLRGAAMLDQHDPYSIGAVMLALLGFTCSFLLYSWAMAYFGWAAGILLWALLTLIIGVVLYFVFRYLIQSYNTHVAEMKASNPDSNPEPFEYLPHVFKSHNDAFAAFMSLGITLFFMSLAHLGYFVPTTWVPATDIDIYVNFLALFLGCCSAGGCYVYLEYQYTQLILMKKTN